MDRKFRVGFCSLVHDHVWGELRHWLNHPKVEIVAVGEESERLRQKATEAGIPKTYDSWQALLENEQVDIVQAASDNATCADITEAAMAKGAHVISEKPMAATLEQANRMLAASKKVGKYLMINWPHIWDPAYQEWERRVLGGEIGRVLHIKRRNAHNGPKEIGCDPAFWEWLYDAKRNGAGAFMDYCCYGADIAARILGLPKRVTGIRGVLAKDYPVPDDNAIILLQYDKAFAQVEASWTEVVRAPGPYTVAYGTMGVCALVGDKVILSKPGGNTEEIKPQPLEYPLRNGPEYLIHCIESGVAVEGCSSPQVSRDAQEILEAGLRSSDSGQHITLPIS
ncbi:MAG TPA: Gfo/Idh/MocA family oxidoreductase [Fimbriimonas sp.]|nr:Gfo/Idh/MocA family oxidoreductase [Fimbriimonas sp.]